MPCYHPMTAYRKDQSGANGKCKIVWKSCANSTPMHLPCGQCVGCRLERSRQWAIRCVHEASLYEHNCFLTLTYNDENLPVDHSLNKKHYQKFMKRLRKKYDDKKIRYYHCGEYGEATEANGYIARPHYHAIIFNHDFEDKKLFTISNGHNLYSSDNLDRLWRKGYANIGDVTFESAAYCARYIMKKVNGDLAQEHYERVDQETGQIIDLQPEYTTMSRGGSVRGKGGIGANWLEMYKEDVFRDDLIILGDGLKLKPPKYYDYIMEIEQPEQYKKTKEKRIVDVKKHAKDLTRARLLQREQVKLAQIKSLNRSL